MLAWERDLNASFLDAQWSKALQCTYSSTKYTKLWELSHKVMQRWSLTPYRITKFNSSLSSLCWRNCMQVGTTFHILWSCRKLAKFWSKIFLILCQITGLPIQLSPSLALLNLGIEDIPPSLRQFTTHLFLAAKLSILRLWRSSPPPPDVSDTLRTLSTHYTYKSMLATLVGKCPNFNKQWQQWIDWHKTHKASQGTPWVSFPQWWILQIYWVYEYFIFEPWVVEFWFLISFPFLSSLL